ncbi:MAG: gliding motility-associated C-terminal domain-containing protein [Bacteroidales bacterium]|nr:gliding motility-associated C-terminal domain-containing protein [Bacteroidales bacterium]
MKTIATTIIMTLALLSAQAQEADYVIEGEQGKEIVLNVSGLLEDGNSQLLVSMIDGNSDDFSVSDLEDGKISFLFNTADEYLFDFKEQLGECSFNTTVRFEILKDIELYIPNIFTPDGDGINDQFHIKYDRRPEVFDIVIYNREGKKMYTSSNPDFQWDGSKCTAGVYSYIIKYHSLGRPKSVSGYITLADRR